MIFFVMVFQGVLRFICDYILGCAKSVETDCVWAEVEVEQHVVNEEDNIEMGKIEWMKSQEIDECRDLRYMIMEREANG